MRPNGNVRPLMADPAEIAEHTGTMDDQPTFWLQADAAGAAPVLYVHGVPTSSEDWRPFLARTGGLAPDLPGFGRAGKRGDLPCTMDFYDGWLEAFLDARGVDRFSLVVHDFGGLALITAQRLADRLDRLVIMNAAPLLPGYRWHRIARLWRTRWLGEIAMGASTGFVLKQLLREANVTPGSLPKTTLDDITRFFDVGTQRSILKLYRSTPETALAAAGAGLGRITCPALVAWGDADPYVPGRFADDYAAALGGPAEVLHLPDAGHWPWLDRPDLVDTVAGFLTA